MSRAFLIAFAAVWLGCAGANAQSVAVQEKVERIDVGPFQNAYFGIAGPSKAFGAGIMGHAFLVFTEKPQDLISGYAYQYNNSVDELLVKKGPGELIRAFAENRLPTVFTRENARAFVDQYSSEDRVVTLYPLKLTPKQVHSLQTQLEDEYIARRGGAVHDYDLFHKNCLTVLIDHVNAVVAKSHALPDPEGALMPINLFNPDTFTANIPLSFDLTLKRSSLVDPSGRMLLLPRTSKQLQSNTVMVPWLKKVSDGCQWSAKKSEVVSRYLFNQKTRYTKAFLSFLTQELRNCAGLAAEDRGLFINFLSYDLQYYSNLPADQEQQLQEIISLARD